MKRKYLLLIVIILLLVLGLLVFRTLQTKDYKSTENSIGQEENLTLEDCKAKEIQNLENNKYLLPEQFSVVFNKKPSKDFIYRLANKYNLEILQIYNDPNVVFRVKKEEAFSVKCQLQNESGIEKVVFIESRPLPLK